MGILALLTSCFSSKIDDEDEFPPPYSSHSSKMDWSPRFDIKVSSPVGTPIYDQMMRGRLESSRVVQDENMPPPYFS
jgi:hypothetical protein